MAISRAELESLDRDELIDAILDLSHRVEQLEDEMRERSQHAAQDRAQIRQETASARDDLKQDLSRDIDRNHRERAKLARRLKQVEDEVGIQPQDAFAVEEGGEAAGNLTKLGRLLQLGPDAVTDNPTMKMYRARELLDNWERWGTTRKDALGTERRLASKKHDLKTRLEDVEETSLAWKQVYRAMELIDEWSGDTIALREGSDAEGKYVLVHRPQEESA